MKKMLTLLVVMLFSGGLLFAQEENNTATTANDSLLQMVSKMKPSEADSVALIVAQGIIDVYNNWNPDKYVEAITPRIMGFIEDFYEVYPTSQFDLAKITLKKADGMPLTKAEARYLVDYKAFKESVYDELSRFIDNKVFYWGYIDDELKSDLEDLANIMGAYVISKDEDSKKTQQESYVDVSNYEKNLFKSFVEILESNEDFEAVEKYKEKKTTYIDTTTNYGKKYSAALAERFSNEHEFFVKIQKIRNLEMWEGHRLRYNETYEKYFKDLALNRTKEIEKIEKLCEYNPELVKAYIKFKLAKAAGSINEDQMIGVLQAEIAKNAIKGIDVTKISQFEYKLEKILSKKELDSAVDYTKQENAFISAINQVVKTSESEISALLPEYKADIEGRIHEAAENYERKEYINARNAWLDDKRLTFDKIRVRTLGIPNKTVSRMLDTYEENNGIKGFDITDQTLTALHEGDQNQVRNILSNAIKLKFYSLLEGNYGFYAKYAVTPKFRDFRINVLIGTFAFMLLFFYTLFKVKRQREKLYIRRIAGLDAIDDAVGRATEMGKPIIYDSGIGGYTSIETIASMLILRNVAKKVAEFKAEIYFPACDPIVLQMAEEMISSGFLDAGYPEDHRKENTFYLAADQFAFAAGISGLTARKKPATCIHFGYYAAESLLISEAGYTAGAIQVAGTTAVAQLPFFITACDYTLIGEELYAAAAYLSREPQILTNLKLSDYGKISLAIIFVIGTIILTINSDWTWFQDIFTTS